MNHIFNGKNIFKRIFYFFGIYADFEADNEKDNSSVSNKTINIYKQNSVLNGYRIVSGMETASKGDYYKSTLGYNNVVRFVNEVKN